MADSNEPKSNEPESADRELFMLYLSEYVDACRALHRYPESPGNVEMVNTSGHMLSKLCHKFGKGEVVLHLPGTLQITIKDYGA